METATIHSNEEILGSLTERFPGLDNYGHPKKAYFERILAMDAQALFKETKDKIWLSAFSNNNPRSDYHWHVDAIHTVYSMRGQEDRYTDAWEQARDSL